MKPALVALVLFFCSVILCGTLISYPLPQRQAVTYPLFPSFHFYEEPDDYIQVSGEFRYTDNIPTVAPQHHSIHCHKQDNVCSHSTIIADGDGYFSHLDGIYPILDWTDSGVTFINTEATCVVQEYTVDRKHQEVRALVRLKEGIPECQKFYEDDREDEWGLVMRNYY